MEVSILWLAFYLHKIANSDQSQIILKECCEMKFEATAARNQNSIGDRMEKRKKNFGWPEWRREKYNKLNYYTMC